MKEIKTGEALTFYGDNGKITFSADGIEIGIEIRHDNNDCPDCDKHVEARYYRRLDSEEQRRLLVWLLKAESREVITDHSTLVRGLVKFRIGTIGCFMTKTGHIVSQGDPESAEESLRQTLCFFAAEAEKRKRESEVRDA